MDGPELIILSVVAVLVYLFLGLRIRQAVHPLRGEASEMIDLLECENALDEKTLSALRNLVRASYYTRSAILIVASVPFLILKRFFSRKNNLEDFGNAATKRRVLMVHRNLIICTVANSPAIAVVFLIEVVLMFAISPVARWGHMLIDGMARSEDWLHSHFAKWAR